MFSQYTGLKYATFRCYPHTTSSILKPLTPQPLSSYSLNSPGSNSTSRRYAQANNSVYRLDERSKRRSVTCVLITTLSITLYIAYTYLLLSRLCRFKKIVGILFVYSFIHSYYALQIPAFLPSLLYAIPLSHPLLLPLFHHYL